jgi:drug/metabolite transporter (DMT)-like permease
MYLGELAGLMTALCWSITSVSFEFAGKRIGSGPVNIIRLVIAFGILSVFNLVTTGSMMALLVPHKQVVLLIISGLIGFVIGDLFLFEALVIIGARISMLIMALAPPLSAIIGFLVLGESMGYKAILGMLVTFSGIAVVILNKNPGKPIKLSHPVKGISFAFLGALGQSVGLLFSKMGMVDMTAFQASQYRVLAGIVGFFVLLSLQGKMSVVKSALKNKKAMMATSIGAFFGPFLGVSLSLIAASLTSLGVASTLMSIVPVVLIPVSVFFFKEKVNIKEIIGAIITVTGVGMMFI